MMSLASMKAEAKILQRPQCHNREWFVRIDRLLKQLVRLPEDTERDTSERIHRTGGLPDGD